MAVGVRGRKTFEAIVRRSDLVGPRLHPRAHRGGQVVYATTDEGTDCTDEAMGKSNRKTRTMIEKGMGIQSGMVDHVGSDVSETGRRRLALLPPGKGDLQNAWEIHGDFRKGDNRLVKCQRASERVGRERWGHGRRTSSASALPVGRIFEFLQRAHS